MKRNALKIVAGLLFVILTFTRCDNKHSSGSLLRSIPEKEGVSSQGIIDFLNATARDSHEFHSLMILRHGKVIAEGWWYPYRRDLKHTLYSLSKSFTATAAGFAVTEGRLSVDDRVITFFPDDLPDSVSTFLSEMRIRDLLSMSAGQEPDPTFRVVTADSNWVRSFLSTAVVNEPGTEFLYNTLATYMLSAIVQKVTGERIVDYLKPRLFDPLGIEGMDWEVDPKGINTGGWGLRLKTEDLAKFGQLFLQKGTWNGKQVLPGSWIAEATSKKIDQDPSATQAARDSSDWLQGYCYQMWRCRNNGFRGDGAYGQYVIVLPEKDAVVAITSETSDMQSELNLVWKYLLPAFMDKELTEDKPAVEELWHRLAVLKLSLPETASDPSIVSRFSGKKFMFEPNSGMVETMEFIFDGMVCRLKLVAGGKTSVFSLGSGEWIEGESELPGPNLLLLAKAHNVGLPPAKVAGSYSLDAEGKLKLVLRFIESPHTETFTCKLEDGKLLVEILNSNDPGHPVTGLKGREDG